MYIVMFKHFQKYRKQELFAGTSKELAEKIYTLFTNLGYNVIIYKRS